MNKTRVNHMLEANHEIYESSQLQYQDQNKTLKRFVNCFSKTYAFDKSDKIRMTQKNSIS